MKEREQKPTLLRMLGYGCGDIYGGGGFIVCNLLIFNFMVIVQGLSVVQASTIIFISKIWDGLIDPGIGLITDHTRSRFGRRRFYFLIGAPIVLLSFVTLWNSFGIVDNKVLYYYHLITNILFCTAFSVTMVPYNAILSDMTNDYSTRTRFTSVRMIFAAAASIVCAVLPSILINAFGGAENGPAQKSGYAAMGWIFGGIFFVVWILTFFGTYEKPEFAEASVNVSVKDWAGIFRNKSYRSLLGLFIFIQVTINAMLALFVFYVDIVLMKYQYYALVMGVLLGFSLIYQIAYMPIAGKISAKKGKRFPLLITIPLWALICCAFYFCTPETPLWLVCVLSAVVAMGPAAGNLCSWSMISDIYDVGEVMTGKRTEGIYSGFTTFCYQCSSGIAILIMGLGLELAGFNQDEYNLLKTLGTVDYGQYASSPVPYAIKLMMVAVPLVFLAVGMFFALRYKLNDRRFTTVQNAIARFKEQGADAVFSEEEKKDLTIVTGYEIDRLWGRLHADKTPEKVK